MHETSVWQRDIDSAAAVLVNACPANTPEQWRTFADQNNGRTRSVYQRCAEISAARREMASL